MATNTVMIATSIGDLVDRITILKLKSERIGNAKPLQHINAELQLLMTSYNTIKIASADLAQFNKLENELMKTNTKLWDYEDLIRKEIHDADVAKTARAIINTNDLRASIKYAINTLLNSEIVEEKSYVTE